MWVKANVHKLPTNIYWSFAAGGLTQMGFTQHCTVKKMKFSKLVQFISVAVVNENFVD